MGFILSEKALDYYKAVNNRKDQGPKYTIMFDLYYLVLMMGLNNRKLGGPDQIKNAPFIDYYPEVYRDKAELIAGLLIDAEMVRKGIKPDDRKSVEKLMLQLIDHMSVTKLSQKGIELLNLYAAGGTNFIYDNISITHELELFLVNYFELINTIEAEI
jgi:hypothetical protein